MSAAVRAWQVQFALLALIWGSSFVLIKEAGHDLQPLQIAFGRMAIGSLFLLGVAALTRQRLPRFGPLWGHLAVVGLLSNAIPFTLFAVGEQHLSSVLAGLWNATTPLFAVLAVLLVLGEHPTRRALVGVAVGFGGVVLLLAPWHAFAVHDLRSHLAFMVAAACYGIGAPYLRRFVSSAKESAIALTTVQLGLAALMVACLLPFGGGLPDHVGVSPGAAVAALGALGSGVAFALLHGIIRAVGPTVATTITYAMPVVSTTLGVSLLGERLTWNLVVGGLVVLAGVLIGGSTKRK